MSLADDIRIEGRRLTVRPAAPLRRYFHGDFWVEYPAGTDLTQVPPSIAILPYVWNMAPVVWAVGHDLEVDELDRGVVESMDTVRDVLRQAYPSLGWKGSITARREIDPATVHRGRYDAGALYSGGLDSTFSVLRHAGEQLLLITISGADVDLRQQWLWQRWQAQAQDFAAQVGFDLVEIRSSLRAMNYHRLNSLSSQVPKWWVDVHFSMALASVTAPLLHLRGIPSLYLAGGLKRDHAKVYRHGSQPRIDNAISLGSAYVVHDGADFGRQHKIQWLTSKSRGARLRVCHEMTQADRGLNCGRCIKCVRTIVGLVVAGADPRDFGFDSYTPGMVDELPGRIAAREFRFAPNEVAMWEEIQAHLPPASATESILVRWLRDTDFKQHRARELRAGPRTRGLARRVAANVPGFSRVRRLNRFRHLLRWLP